MTKKNKRNFRSNIQVWISSLSTFGQILNLTRFQGFPLHMEVMTLILKDYYIVSEETFIQLLELFTVIVFAQEEEVKAIMIVKSYTCVFKQWGLSLRPSLRPESVQSRCEHYF